MAVKVTGGGGNIEMLESHFVGGGKPALIVEYLLERWESVI